MGNGYIYTYIYIVDNGSDELRDDRIYMPDHF